MFFRIFSDMSNLAEQEGSRSAEAFAANNPTVTLLMHGTLLDKTCNRRPSSSAHSDQGATRSAGQLRLMQLHCIRRMLKRTQRSTLHA
jgi:hypothetical protein